MMKARIHLTMKSLPSLVFNSCCNESSKFIAAFLVLQWVAVTSTFETAKMLCLVQVVKNLLGKISILVNMKCV